MRQPSVRSSTISSIRARTADVFSEFVHKNRRCPTGCLSCIFVTKLKKALTLKTDTHVEHRFHITGFVEKTCNAVMQQVGLLVTRNILERNDLHVSRRILIVLSNFDLWRPSSKTSNSNCLNLSHGHK